MAFRDRPDAGRCLAEKLSRLAFERPLVLGLPRGGVPVAAEVADVLGAPLDVFVARKVGAPGHEELGIGAVAEGLDRPIFTDSISRWEHSPADLEALASSARRELERRVAQYRGDRPLPDLAGRDIILVDDGMATGVTAEAALRALGQAQPGRLVLAVPVCAAETAQRLAAFADEMVCAETPSRFSAVGQWYDDFSQTTDDEVLDLLARSRAGSARGQKGSR